MSLSTLLAVCSGVAFVAYGVSCLHSTAMKVEFTRFGLERLRVLTGVLEVLGGVGLLGGLFWTPALRLSSGGLALLMLMGVGVRLRVRDGVLQTVPALVLMFVNLWILFTSWSR